MYLLLWHAGEGWDGMEKMNPKRSLLGKHSIFSKRRQHGHALHSNNGLTNYLWDAGCDGHSEQIHGYTHAAHHEEQQAMAGVAVGAQALLSVGKEKTNKTGGTCMMLLTVATFISAVDSLERQLCLWENLLPGSRQNLQPPRHSCRYSLWTTHTHTHTAEIPDKPGSVNNH